MDIQVISRGTKQVFSPGMRIRIGRNTESGVHVDDPMVSREHALVDDRDGVWTFRDTSSRGSYVAGVRITEVKVSGRVEVALGSPSGPIVTFRPMDMTDVSSGETLRPSRSFDQVAKVGSGPKSAQGQSLICRERMLRPRCASSFQLEAG